MYKKVCIAFMVVVLFMVSSFSLPFAKAATDRVSEFGLERIQEYKYSDIEIIDGLVFGIGVFAYDIGNSLEGAFPDEELEIYISEAVKFRGKLFDEHPEELKHAVEGIRSGNVNYVESSLEGLAKLILKYANQDKTNQEAGEGTKLDVYASHASKVAPKVCTPYTFCAVALAVYALVLVHNSVGVTALAAVVVGGYLWCGVATGCGKSSRSVSGNNEVRAYERFIANATKLASYAV